CARAPYWGGALDVW
nr:immunoglobulin heavy chain junction region [Macaca mulatta]MOW19810.1 immunoglobulin heavy chain junction region [Macaca mulatta]MOW20711.1 immunoglobulin heavy chain junction region [Macaca mulatta]MOW21521.1 immunoglobulin heavy chain junction region [Macaca mulatta]MOW22174.1 immunoglobulin heavy chain junction region [Macaca mulatta]